MIFVGVAGFVVIVILSDLALTMMTRTVILVERPSMVVPLVDEVQSDALWDPDRMGKLLQKELDKVEAAR